jgi:RNA polymerase sigma factor (sigma-70 family)
MTETFDQGTDWFNLYRRGDATAFQKVFELHYRSILYYAMKILHEDSYAEDIVSESFKKAWDYRDRMDTPRRLENFLYFVTRNACISWLRSDRATQSVEKEWGRLADTQEKDEVLDLERVQTELIHLICQHLKNYQAEISSECLI